MEVVVRKSLSKVEKYVFYKLNKICKNIFVIKINIKLFQNRKKKIISLLVWEHILFENQKLNS